MTNVRLMASKVKQELRKGGQFFYWLIRGDLLRLWRRSGRRWRNWAMINPPYIIAYHNKEWFVEGLSGDKDAGWIYKEIIVDDDYGLFSLRNAGGNIKVIVDFGANVGLFSSTASILFPGARIFAYEGQPQALAALYKNAERFNFQVTPNFVSDRRTEKINLTVKSTCRTAVGGGDIEVACVLPSEVAPGEKIDLLKMDIEGSEAVVLCDKNLLRRARRIRMEYHFKPGFEWKDLTQMLNAGGHKVIRRFDAKRNVGNFEEIGNVWTELKDES